VAGRPALIEALRDSLGLAQQLIAGGQTAAVLTDILEIFKFALAIVLLMGGMLETAVGALLGRPLGIAQVPGLRRHGPAGFTDKRFLFHGSLLVYTSGYTKSNPDKEVVNSFNNILIKGFLRSVQERNVKVAVVVSRRAVAPRGRV
jgi:hypothetical protein